MPRGARIAPAERRRWLEEYEGGSRIDKIAREAGRTERTVVDHLARARRERQQQEVTSGLLTQAYQHHYAQLLETAEQLSRCAGRANPHGILGAADRDTRMLYQGLKAHIPSSRLWREIRNWEQSSVELTEKTQEIRQKIEARVGELIASWPEILAQGFGESLCDAVLVATEGRAPEMIEYRRETSGGSSQLCWRNFILASAGGTQERLAGIQEKHRDLLVEMVKPSNLASLGRVMARWQNSRDIIQEEVAVLRLRQILPGQCRLCPGGEAPSSRHSGKKGRSDE